MKRNKVRGMTLLEVMLVLAIAASLILLGFQQYQIYDNDKNYLLLRYNVEEMFQGMKQYYQVNCDNWVDASGATIRSGTLAPSQLTDLTVPFPVSINDIQPYLPKDWPRFTSVVTNNNDVNSYTAQFNPGSPPPERNAYACFYFGDSSPQCTDPKQTKIANSKILLWVAQIAVQMADPTKTVAYAGVVGADCAVNSIPADRAINCSQDGVSEGNANYLVWQRLPSFASTANKSEHTLSNPVAKQFKLQYTHDPMYEMYNPNAGSQYQYYLCGG